MTTQVYRDEYAAMQEAKRLNGERKTTAFEYVVAPHYELRGEPEAWRMVVTGFYVAACSND